MPIDRRAARLLNMLAAADEAEGEDTPAQRRRSIEALIALTDSEPPVLPSVCDLAVPGSAGAIPVRLYRPLAPDARPRPALVFLHGGGWVAGGLASHDGLCRRLAKGSGCVFIAVDYRLAPEHPLPAALEDGLAVVAWVAANAGALGVDEKRLGVAGDSAGGGLAAAVAQMTLEKGGPALAAQLLLCPILDVSRRSASRVEFATGYFVDERTFARDLAAYRPEGVDLGDPRLSPLLDRRLSGLPPAIIHTAEFDPFRDEGEAYASALSSAGVSARLTRHLGMIHFFYAMPRAIPYALAALDQIGAELGQALAPPGKAT